MRDYRLRAQRKRKQRESERRQGGVGFDRFLTSLFFFLCCVHRRSGRDGRETRHSTVVRANNLLYFVAPNCPRASREPPRTRHRVEREGERERESLRRWILGARKFADKRARERERGRQREKEKKTGIMDRSVARRLADSSRARWTMICYYTEICQFFVLHISVKIEWEQQKCRCVVFLSLFFFFLFFFKENDEDKKEKVNVITNRRFLSSWV